MSIIDKAKSLIEEVKSLQAKSAQEAEDLRIKYLGKKGEITALFAAFKDVAREEKKELGQLLNVLKTSAQAKVNELKEKAQGNSPSSVVIPDLSRPVFPSLGSRHPVSVVKNEIIEIFSSLDRKSVV